MGRNQPKRDLDSFMCVRQSVWAGWVNQFLFLLQLLSVIVAQENETLQHEKDAVVEELTETRRRLNQLEDRVLFYLSSCRANIVDDESAVNVGACLAAAAETAAIPAIAMPHRKK